MKALAHEHATDVSSAVRAVASSPDAAFLAGGSNLVDHLKLGVTAPSRLVDITRLPLDTIEETDDGGLRIGATVRNSDLAAHAVVRERYPVMARALLAGASGQIRNQATTGGNLLQRTRCVYFQDITTPCNKRQPGSGCSAREGYGHDNAILGASPECVTVHPSDFAVSLSVLDATVVTAGPHGERRFPYAELHRLPGEHPERDTTLERGELITAIELPPLAREIRSTYHKVRDRASYAFALVSVAAAVEMDGPRLADVRVAWGGVAHRPWRAHRLEETLRGQEPTPKAIRAALDAELEAADPTSQAAFKVPMVRRTTAMVLRDLTDGRTR